MKRIIFDYWQKGRGDDLLFLHGWSKDINKEKYLELLDKLATKYRVTAIDFPGFGKSERPSTPWKVENFAYFVKKAVEQLGLSVSVIVGHSFGGRVAIKIVNLDLLAPEKLVLIASAGIERKTIKVKLIKFLVSLVPERFKRIISVGSKDYREAQGVMKETMKLVVEENLENDLARINIPTLLIWGNEDRTTPLWQGQLMNKLISKSDLKIIEGGNHGIPYRNAEEVFKIIETNL